jgi:hypothetical protein
VGLRSVMIPVERKFSEEDTLRKETTEETEPHRGGCRTRRRVVAGIDTRVE